MRIQYFGHSCFALTSWAGTTVVTDPYEGIGFSLPHGITADAVAVTHGHHDHCNVKAIGGSPAVFSSAGHFSVGDIEIFAEEHFHDDVRGAKRGKTLVFRFFIDGWNICHLGDLGEPYSKEIGANLSPDVLLIPVGGTYTIDARQAKEYCDNLSPRVVIPMHYKVKGLNLPISPVEDFLKLFPKDIVTRMGASVEFTKKPNEKKIIVMERLI